MIHKLEVIKFGDVIQVDQSWVKFIKYVQENVPFGTVTIEFKDGKPFEATRVLPTQRFS